MANRTTQITKRVLVVPDDANARTTQVVKRVLVAGATVTAYPVVLTNHAKVIFID